MKKNVTKKRENIENKVNKRQDYKFQHPKK